MIRASAILLCSVFLIAPSAHADFADGAQAFDGGDYTTAFAEWIRLAETGDVTAQVAIAGIYRAGTGRTVDIGKAAHWYSKAARAGDAVAQMNLGEMYQHGWGVKQDPVMAYGWYERAAAQGKQWAATQQEALAKSMTADQIAAARNGVKN
ncbi:MAG: TPR repeat protein [Alphaproteobacteria bacterium]|jgi:TPR repeat protein